jgi:epoxyqueuosine reductase
VHQYSIPRRLRTLEPLGEQCTDQSGQHITHSGHGHARIAITAECQGSTPYSLAGTGNQAADPLEYQRTAKASDQPSTGIDPVSLHRCRIATKQSARLCRMRCQHAMPTQGRRHAGLRQHVQRVGIEHAGPSTVQGSVEQPSAPDGPAQPRTHDDGSSLFQRGQITVLLVDTTRHYFRAACENRWHVLAARQHGDLACASAQGGFSGKHDGPTHSVIAPQQKQMSEHSFMGRTWARRQHLLPACQVKALCHGQFERWPRLYQAGKFQLTHLIRPLGGEQPGVEGDEGDGHVRPDRAALHDSTVRMQATGNIDGHYRQTGPIDFLDGIAINTAYGALQPGAQQGIQQYAAHFRIDVPGTDIHPGLPGPLCGLRRVTPEPCERRNGVNLHFPPGLLREQGNQVAITGIVATTTENRESSGFGPAPQQRSPGGLCGALHELQSGYAGLDNGGIQTARLGSGKKLAGQFGSSGHVNAPILWQNHRPACHRLAIMPISAPPPAELARAIGDMAKALGFQQTGISEPDLAQHERWLDAWLSAGYQGEMQWMASHGTKRTRPAELVPGTRRVISVRMDYLPGDTLMARRLSQPDVAYISRYALGRDYHKLMRRRLQQLAEGIQALIGPFGYRAFVDSAPVMERALAAQAGLGWIGKNSMLLNRHAGSFFFLGELFTDLPLPVDTSDAEDHCGRCTACLDRCPTDAFVDARVLDARRCISYLTIELKGAIPEGLRPLMGNRVFGCDDCQLVCPWNRFAKASREEDFAPRHRLDQAELVELFRWDEEQFLRYTEGSPIRRIGHERWLRNLAVGLGNATTSIPVIEALRARLTHPSALVQEHVAWALARHGVSSG